MGKNNGSKVVAQWPGKHGPVSGAFNAAAGTAALTMSADLAGISPAWAALAGGTGAMLVGGHALFSEMPLSSVAYRMACWAGAGGWAAWAIADSPWSFSNLAALGIGAMGAGMFAALRARRERQAQDGQLRVTLGLPRYKLAAEWESRITRVTRRKGIRVIGVEMWDSGAGFTLDLDLPVGGMTWNDLVGSKNGLASDAALPNACGVEVMPGLHRRRALMGVNTLDVLKEERTLPSEYGKLSILNVQELGWYRDGTVASADLRQETWLVVGRKGSGKTTLLHRTIGNLTRCTDALVWVIDLNKGGLGAPWALPWWEGRTNESAVDWIAPNGKQALWMTEVALAIAKDRKATSYKLKREQNVTLMPVSPELPEIVIVCDEVAEIIGERTKYPMVRDNICELQRIARDAGVNLVLAALRGTADVVDTAVKAGCSVRVAMKMSDEAEIGNSIGWHSGIRPEDIPYKGSGILVTDETGTGQGARPFKGADMLPSQIDECAVATAGLRPKLDARAQKVAALVKIGDETNVYERRWEEADAMFGEYEPVAAKAGGAENGEMDKPSMTPEQALAQIRAAGQEVRRLQAIEDGQDPEIAEQFHTLMKDVGPSSTAVWPDAEPKYPVPGVLVRILEALGDDQREFLSTADLAAAIGYDIQYGAKAAERLGQELTRLDVPRVRERRPEYGGEPTRGFLLADLRDAAADFKRGRRSSI